MRLPVVGGPLDGLDARAGEVFVWIGTRRKHVGTVAIKGEAIPLTEDQGTVYAEQRADRHLYRRQADAYVYAGDTHRRCENCGGWVAKAERGAESVDCPLCGGRAPSRNCRCVIVSGYRTAAEHKAVVGRAKQGASPHDPVDIDLG